MSHITLTSWRWVPPFAQGLVRDLRVRWALDEAGFDYAEHLIGFDAKAAADFRQRQPFGQVPVFEQDGLVLFESGAIVLHIAEQSPALMAREPDQAARTRTWMFAALNTVEPPIQALGAPGMAAPKSDGVVAERNEMAALVAMRLDSLSDWLQGRNWLNGDFSAADLLMCTVLRILRDTDFVTSRPRLHAYQQRCEQRPAFQKALAAQLAAFAANAPPAV